MKQLSLSIVLALLAVFVQAQQSIFSANGKAAHGWDVVSLITHEEAVQGKQEYQCTWSNAQWFFISAENRDIFLKSPDKYAPRYGGFCAYGASRGYKAPTEADTWTIVEGKLYFNFNLKVRMEWNKDKQNYIQKADNNWLKLNQSE